MQLVVTIGTIWIALDLLVLATIWYGVSTIQPLAPNLWRNYVCDNAPDFFD